MITKFVNGMQDNWDVYLLAFLYTYQMSLHQYTGHTPYKAMLGRAPLSEDGVATGPTSISITTTITIASSIATLAFIASITASTTRLLLPLP